LLTEPLLGLSTKEKDGNLFRLTYFKFLICPTVKLPYKLGRSVRGVQFDGSKDIYSKVVVEILENKSINEITKNLYEKYQDCKDKSVYDINNFLSSSKIKHQPSWLMIYPWENINHRTLRKSYLNSFYHNRSANGMSFTNKKLKYIEDRMTSYDAAKSHILQFKNLINKIKQHGYIENHDDYPTAVILIKDNKWKWMMSSSGNHRSHIKKELNFNFINCKIIGIVNLTNAKNYKNVRNGTFNEEEASILFENAFEGKIPIRGVL
tara:strand:- start:76 stop:867 length:792 start_codon:yes stop_codon:yes gene_type:complete